MTTTQSWIDLYQLYPKKHQAPKLYHQWVAISTIASALGRSVFIDRQAYILYPNLYVVLIGEPAVTKKSSAINLGYSLLESVRADLPLYEQKVTMQQLVFTMAKYYKDQGTSSMAIIKAPELITFLGTDAVGSGLIPFLTTAYDCPNKWEYSTVKHGRVPLPNAVLNIIGGSTMEWLRDAIPKTATRGGFTSRVVFVNPPPGIPVANPEVAHELEESLQSQLRRISILQGQIKLEPAAESWYETWYNEFHAWMPPASGHLFGRFPDFLLKVALARVASFGELHDLTIIDLEWARDRVTEITPYVLEILQQMDATPEGDDNNRVFRVVSRICRNNKANGGDGICERQELLRDLSRYYNAFQITNIVGTLVEGGYIDRAVVAFPSSGDRRKEVYTLPEGAR